MAEHDFDVVVIGAGPGGYVCAIRCAQLGLKTACVEKRSALGGTCLNIGCIPSKALLQSSELYEQANGHLGHHGVKVAGVELDLPTMMKRKDKVVDTLTKGIAGLFKKNKVTHLSGSGRIVDANTVEVDGKSHSTANIVIATGSDSATLPGIEIDEKRIVSSTGALDLPEVPKRMVVIGGGIIGLELGSVWRRLGSEVTVVEYLDRIAPGIDNEAAKELQKLLKRQGMTFRLGSKVTDVKTLKKELKIYVEPAAGGDPETIACDVVLMSVGRKAHTEGLGLAEAGVATDDRGRVEIDDHFATSVPGVYAIGDCVRGAMLAHKAEDEGMAVAETIAGQSGHVNYDVIPGVVYTEPEAASVGKTEEELQEAGVDYVIGKFPMLANSRARTYDQTGGLVKVLADAKTDRVLGVHILGTSAGELIAEAAVAMEFGASSEDIARTCHAHPTFSEAVREAALAVDKRAIHF
ncbi:MAG: dihydrolipoyl dehydrogenase [Rhodospirillaceae bacterium]|mgnify:CR=1 FL=1|nr:dihydrolipoyl dehydrogenase [Rhodospirillaceae bacterium]|tara:strand:+ start:17910 stop:19304 length:1395 start_codon:yes stop_codon:yes gene_type:complete